MKACVKKCVIMKKECEERLCRMWINFPEELNCSFVSIQLNGHMTLKEIATMLNTSAVTIHETEKKAVNKVKYLLEFDLLP